MKQSKRLLALLLAMMMCISLLPVSAFAEEEYPAEEPEVIAEVQEEPAPAEEELPEAPAEPAEEPAQLEEAAEEAEEPEEAPAAEESTEALQAEEPEDEEAVLETGSLDTVLVVNPHYSDVITEDDLLKPEDLSQLLMAEMVPDEQPLSIAIRDAMMNRRETVVFNITYTLTAAEVDEERAHQWPVMSQMLGEYIESQFEEAMMHTGNPVGGDYLAWQYGGWSSSSDQFRYPIYSDKTRIVEIPLTVTIAITYYDTLSQETALNSRVNSIVASLTSQIGPNATEYEKLAAVNDYLCRNVVYDHANLNIETYKLKFTAYAALMNGTAVCQGYANAFYRLALALGVDSRIISGEGNGGAHGWNIGKIDDLYYDIDATWDAGRYAYGYDYFLMGHTEFSESHKRDDKYETAAFHMAYPMSADRYTPHTHSFIDYISDNNATCTADGTKTATCTSCSATRTIPDPGTKLEHDYAAVVTAATCTADGYTTYTCRNCSDSYVGDETDALEHDYAAVVTAPTCSVGGYTTYTCRRCDDSYIDNETAALDHDYAAVVTAPTCTEAGYTTYTCIRCNDSYVSDKTAALGHDCTAEETAATCTEAGYMTYTCVRCSNIIYTEELPALDHDCTAEETAATCTEAGYTTYTCVRCNNIIYTEELPALGHDYTAEETAATCTEAGYTTYTCTRCSDSYTDNKTDALGHGYTVTSTEEATCTKAGSITYTCARGDDEYAEEIPALGHSYTAVTTDATCTADGYTTYTCSRCDDSYIDNETAALDHDYAAVVTASTCTEAGCTTYTCIRCNDSYVSDKTAALGHDCTAEETAATCTEAGYMTYTCVRCSNIIYTEEIPALGHDYTAEETAATCTEEGYTTYTCSRCEDSYVIDKTAALGHSLHLVPGETESCICERCGESFALDLILPESLTLRQRILTLREGDQAKVSIENEAELNGLVPAWSSEKPAIATVDEEGMVTAVSAGTTYVLCKLGNGEDALIARCRVDVTEKTVEEEIAAEDAVLSVGLVQQTAAVSLYSTDYTAVNVLLMLPQNLLNAAPASETQNSGAAITGARFANPAADAAFELWVKDDRTLEIHPTAQALSGSLTLAKTYTSPLLVRVGSTEFETAALKVTLNTALPKLKAAAVKFNTFETGCTQPLVITGGEVTEVSILTPVAGISLGADGMSLALADGAAPKAGKLTLRCQVNGWAVPVDVAASFGYANKNASLKLKASTLTVHSGGYDTASTSFTITPDVFADAAKYPVELINDYEGAVAAEIAGNTVTVKAPALLNGTAAVTYRLYLRVNGAQTALNVKVLPAAMAVTATAKATGTIDTAIPDSPVQLSTTLKNLNAGSGETYDLKIFTLNAAKQKEYVTELFQVLGSDGSFTITQRPGAELNAAAVYQAEVEVYNNSGEWLATSKPVKVAVKASLPAKVPVSVTLKAAGTLDPVRPASTVTITPTIKNCYGFVPAAEDLQFAKLVGKVTEPVTNSGEIFAVSVVNGSYVIQLKDAALVDMSAKYQVYFRADVKGTAVSTEAKKTALNIKMGSASILQSTKTLSLLQQDRFDRAELKLSPAAGLSDIAEVELDAKSSLYFEVTPLGNGTYAIGFKDNQVAAGAKSTTVKLSIKLQGNTTAKANATVSVKLNLVKVK